MTIGLSVDDCIRIANWENISDVLKKEDNSWVDKFDSDCVDDSKCVTVACPLDPFERLMCTSCQ